MRSLKVAALPLALALVSAAPAAPAAPVALAPPGPGYTVKYRTATSVFLDAGHARGLSVGDRLRVMQGQTVVAELEVVYAAEHSASCKVISETRPVRAGDVVVPVALPAAAAPAGAESTPAAPAAPAAPAPVAAAVPAAAAAAPAPARSYTAPWARVRGAASVGYYKTWDQTESGLDFSQLTARLDLGLYDIAGQPLSFMARLRSRQDYRALTLSPQTPQSERTDRLYELALRYEPPSDRFGFEVGRIGIYRFVGIGYLDGGLARYRLVDNLQIGAFGGRLADVETLGIGGTGQKYGGFVRLVPAGRHGAGGYDATLAFVRENADGDVSREYLSLESRWSDGRVWSFERAELDLNHGWRQEATGTSYQFSNVSLSANVRLSPSASAFASYDGRRNYRYYLNRTVPSEVFDNLLHRGVRAGLNYSRAGGFGATAGFGMNLKEQDPLHPELNLANAWSANAGLRHASLFSSSYSVRLDGTGFSNGYTSGGLLTASVGRYLQGGHMLDLSYGLSSYSVKQAELTALSQTSQSRTTQWLRLRGRAELGHRVYGQGDFEYDTGADLKGPRAFLELGYLF